MTLKGNLEVLNLSDIFQSLSLNKHTGTLVVTDGKREKLIYFSEGEITLFSSDKRIRIGDMLVSAGKIGREDLEYALQAQDSQNVGHNTQALKLGEILVEEGFVTEGDVEEIVKAQIAEEIYDLFLWKKADFEFLIDYCPDKLRRPSCNVTTLRFNTNSLIMEAARRLDEWVQIQQEIPSLKAVYQLTAPADEVVDSIDLPRHIRHEAEHIDGYHTVDYLADHASVTRFELCRLLYDLKTEGFIEPVPPDQLQERAEELYEQSRFREASMLYERLVETLPKVVALRKAYAEALLAFGDEQRALLEYLALADQLEASRRDKGEVVRALRAALDIDPGHAEVQERLRHIGRSGAGRSLMRVAVAVLITVPIGMGVAAWVLAPDKVRAVIARILPTKRSGPTVVDAAESDARELYRRSQALVARGHLKEAWSKLRALVEKYPKTGAAKQVRLPMRVESNPPGKLVRLNGIIHGPTPQVVYYLPDTLELRLELTDGQRVLWKTTLDAGAYHAIAHDFNRKPAWTVDLGAPIRVAPVVYEGVLYVPTLDGKLHGVRLEDQTRVLDRSLRPNVPDPVGEVTGAPVVAGGLLCLATLNGAVMRLDPHDDNKVARLRLSEEPLLAPPAVLPGGLVALSGYLGELVLYDARTNASRKSLPLFANEVRAGLVPTPQGCLVASLDNRLLSLLIHRESAEVKIAWQHDAGADLQVAPAVSASDVLVADEAGRLWCLGLADGAVRWSRDVGTPSQGVAIEHGFGVVSLADGKLISLDMRTGDEIWSRSFRPGIGRPIIDRRVVYVVGSDGSVNAIDYLSDGADLWTGRADGVARRGPAVLVDRHLYFGTEDGRLVCYAID